LNADDINPDLDTILGIATQLVKSKGIKAIHLNPWNWIEKASSRDSETEYVSEAYSKLIRWARKFQCHVFVVAHTTKLSPKTGTKMPIPTLYDISGSANFYNKTSNGITVYRDKESGNTDVYVQKVKQYWFGRKGWVSFKFDVMTRQYRFVTIDDPDSMKQPADLPPGNWKLLPQQEQLPF
jgi:twinkle protein